MTVNRADERTGTGRSRVTATSEDRAGERSERDCLLVKLHDFEAGKLIVR